VAAPTTSRAVNGSPSGESLDAASDEPPAPRDDEPSRSSPGKALGIAALVLLAAVLVSFFVLTLYPEEGHNLVYESAKFLIQAVIVVFIGNFLFTKYQRRVEKKRAANEFRRFLLKGLMRAYTETKKARRLLRASCLLTDNLPGIPYEGYEKHLQLINVTQLELEVLAKEVKIFRKAFSSRENAEKVRRQVRDMDESLKELVTEFETALGQFHDRKACIPLSALKHLEEFIRPHKQGGNFSKQLADRYDVAVKVLLEEGLKIY
jgi:hypothetical protein